jgi:hypothetical protein
MSRELDLLAREFSKKPCAVLRTELNLYQTQINQAAAPFLREVAAHSKKNKAASVSLVAVLLDNP